jgi:hypothetical protein
MDRMTAQISELSEAERFQLLVRLSREVPNSVWQSRISAVRDRRRIRQDIPVSGYVLHGFEAEQPVG